MSNIYTDNINGNYPIAGQDNNSQGFRDNFTSIKNNLTIAKNEIAELQTKAVLTAALNNGASLGNDFNYTLVKDMQTQSFAERIVALGTLTGAVSIDFSAGHVQTLTTSGSVTLSFTNTPTTSGFNMLGRMKVIVNVANTGHTVKLASSVIVTGVSTTQIAAGIGGDVGLNVITFLTTGNHVLDFSIINTSPATIYLDNISVPDNKFASVLAEGTLTVNADEAISAAGAASLTTHATLFTTSEADMAVSLAAGTEGQIKVLVLASLTAGGNSVKVSVANAGWATDAQPNGKITLDAKGEAVTLQCLNTKWYCIGNNGATFTTEAPTP
jgi:hypothetical protein